MGELKRTIELNGGIQPPHIAFYMEAISFNVNSSINSIEFVADFINMTKETQGNYELNEHENNQILDHIQNILIHAGAISRYFWPVREGHNKLHKHRSITLKSFFKINDNSALRNRKLRNQLEHFDENLDNYLWNKPITGYVIPSYVDGEFKSNVPVHFFRAYYTDSGVFETLGNRYEIQPIIDQIIYLHQHLSGDVSNID